MELINKVIAFVFSVTVLSNTLLGGGLIWSDAHLTEWRDRAINGPYKMAGDAFDPLIPGEWQRIVSEKDSFMSNPSADRESVLLIPETPLYYPKGQNTVSAAFYALVKKDSSVAASVKAEILWHARASGTQVSPTRVMVTDDGNWWKASWLMRYLVGASFIEDSFTSGELTEVKDWLSNWAQAYDLSVNKELAQCFPNRYSRDYSRTGSPASSSYYSRYAYLDSNGTGHNQIAAVARYYNNRRSTIMGFVGLASVWLQDVTLIDHSKLYFEEWLQFSVFPDGSVGEYDRNRSSTSSSNVMQGLIYNGANLESAITLASALSINGDDSLFQYSTTNGIWGTESTGGDPAKSLKLAVNTHMDLIENEKLWYAADGSVVTANRIDSKAESGNNNGTQWNVEIYFAPIGNRYWKDARIKNGYMRTSTNSIPYSSKFGTAGPLSGPWKGHHAAFPSMLFMFADMENVGTGPVTPPVTPPTGPVYPQGYREATVGGQLVFGLDPVWGAGREFEAVFDGDPSTFYDYKNGDETFVGIDLGESTLVQALHYHPRIGLENRMVGGRFEGSNESSVSGYETIHVIATEPSAAAQVINLDPAAAYRYYRYLAPAGGYGNIAEFSVEFPVLVVEVDSDNLPDAWEIQYFGGINAVNGGETEDFDGDGSSNYDEWLAGTDPSNATDFPVVTPPGGIVYPDGYREAMLGGLLRFGLDPAWSVGSEFEQVFDGDASTFYDYINGAGGFAGMDIGESRVVAAINFQPRSGQAKRMVGGRFEGSNESSVSGYQTIYVIAAEPSSTAQSVDVSSGMAYRYYRYLSPANGFGNIAEFSLELEVVVADSDNLPDAWEIQYFGGINAVNGGEAEDFDGDGSSNYDEWLAGTDPSDATDLLELRPVVGVAWTSVRDRSYEIDYSDNNWKTFITSETLLGGGGPMVWIDPSDGTLIHKRQYRVQIVAQ